MNVKVKVLSFCFAALMSNRAQATGFFCQESVFESKSYLIVTKQAYPSRIPIAEILFFENGQLSVYQGWYQGPDSELFDSHVFSIAGQLSGTLTISKPKIDPAHSLPKWPHCEITALGCSSAPKKDKMQKQTDDQFVAHQKSKIFDGLLKLNNNPEKIYDCHKI